MKLKEKFYNQQKSKGLLKSTATIPVPFKSGYIPIDTDNLKTAKDKTFYLFFPSRANPEYDPLIIWFTGGPGCSSELAVATENGPFKVVRDANGKPKAERTQYSWNNNANLLYIDNPLEVGFSILRSGPPISTETQIAKDVETFLLRWLALEEFSSLKGRDLFITGESYAGHYVPWISNHLYSLKNPWIKLRGLAIGNGLSSPNLQYPEYKTFVELPENTRFTKLSANEAALLDKFSPLCNQMINHRNRRLPLNYKFVCESISGIILAPTPEEVKKGKQMRFNLYNIKNPCPTQFGLCYDFTAVTEFFNQIQTQQELGVAQEHIVFTTCSNAGAGLQRADWWVDASSQLTKLLDNNIKVLVYSGDLDYICNWKGGEKWTFEMEWKHKEGFQKTEFEERMDPYGTVAIGNSRKYENFEFLRFFDAGHLVPMDQPYHALVMINELIGQPVPLNSEN